jgi:hypothetical protein
MVNQTPYKVRFLHPRWGYGTRLLRRGGNHEVPVAGNAYPEERGEQTSFRACKKIARRPYIFTSLLLYSGSDGQPGNSLRAVLPM